MKRDHWFFANADRYALDSGACSHRKGFAQCDTGQDAWYFGTWANPEKLVVVEFIEGDLYKTTCDTPAEFVEKLRDIARWNRENGFKFAIDTMCNDRITRRFVELGLGDLFHPGTIKEVDP